MTMSCQEFTGTGGVKSFYAPYFCPSCQREKLLHVQVHEGEGLARALADDLVVAVELRVAVGAHVHAHVHLLLGQATQLLARYRHRDRRVDEALAKAGAAVGGLLPFAQVKS